ncbi:MAG TPA: hypothetical protein VMY42_01630 [Thermoguttaceae bacterium]|nr:hypothetical protein [Thermoguttaceae bacterium]
MRRHLVFLMAIATLSPASTARAEASWIFRPSTYSHDPQTGKRVHQFAPKQPAYKRDDSTYFQSGYRHRRWTLRGPDGSADRLHVVDTWGAGEAIRPYGEWQYPYRAGATPYGPWGNPQGPWTMPFDSWSNPYGQWNRYPLYYGGPGYGPGYGAPQGGMQGGPSPGSNPTFQHEPPHASPQGP